MIKRPLATQVQKENFKTKFAEIVKDNDKLRDNYKIQFFDTAAASNYVIYGLDGKSINVTLSLTAEELDKYFALKNNWQN
jgi:hypothetical protein